MTTRRGFLKALGVMAAAAALPAVAANAIQPNKYEVAIALYDQCVATRKNNDALHTNFDALLKHLHANFTTEVTDANIALTVDVLKSADIEGWRRIPPTVIDAVYPIALARMALKYDELPLRPTKLKQFDTFHERYGVLIISACA